MAGNQDEKSLVIDGFRYIAVPVSSSADVGGLRVTHKIKIGFKPSGEPEIVDKTVFIRNGDEIIWVCDKPFLIRFMKKQTPDTSKADYLFDSDPTADATGHSKAITFNGHANMTQLDYEAIVETRLAAQWMAADPSIIIDENRHLYVLQRVQQK